MGTQLGNVWFEVLDDYDHAVWDVEHDRKRYLTYEVMGMSDKDITVGEEFVNKTQKIYITAKGNAKDEITGVDNDINVRLLVDTEIYDRWSYEIFNGLLTIILYEKKNRSPHLSQVIPNSPAALDDR